MFFIMRLLQNFSFCNNNLRFKGKTGLLDGFSKACCETNRVLQQALIFNINEQLFNCLRQRSA